MTDTQVTSQERNGRKIREGLVVSTAMEKTIVVAVTERVPMPAISKQFNRPRSSTYTTSKTMPAQATEFELWKLDPCQRKSDGG